MSKMADRISEFSNLSRVCAIIVTYNRKKLLLNCINSLLKGVLVPDIILIIDNASIDDTETCIKNAFKEHIKYGFVRYMRLQENLGGAGGFHEGLKEALRLPADAFWLMDDDGEVDRYALFELVKHIRDDCCVASIATDQEKKELSWGTGIKLGDRVRMLEHFSDIPEGVPLKAPWCPFLGFLIPRTIVEKVGLPRKEYFIWGDDVEYAKRIWEAGFSIFYVKESIIYHPVQTKRKTRFLWKKDILVIDAQDWKQYYGLRNHVHMLSRRGHFLDMINRIAFFFIVWKARGARKDTLHYYLEGLWDGLRGRLGKRYTGDKCP